MFCGKTVEIGEYAIDKQAKSFFWCLPFRALYLYNRFQDEISIRSMMLLLLCDNSDRMAYDSIQVILGSYSVLPADLDTANLSHVAQAGPQPCRRHTVFVFQAASDPLPILIRLLFTSPLKTLLISS